MLLLNKKIFQLIIVFFAILLNGCDKNNMILEEKYIFNLKVLKISKDNNDYLVISGLCGHSAYGIKSISYQREKNKIIMLIKLAYNHNGNFKEEIKIPENVTEVVLGKKQSVLWKRTDSSASGTSGGKPFTLPSGATHK